MQPLGSLEALLNMCAGSVESSVERVRSPASLTLKLMLEELLNNVLNVVVKSKKT
jgi:hypothetical protein